MIRLILLFILLLVSLLAVFKAPTYHLWLISILVGEFPLIFITITFLLLLSGIWFRSFQLQGIVVGLLAIVLFISPAIRAYFVARNLRDAFSKTFEKADDKDLAFMFSGMLIGRNTRHINLVEYSYSTVAGRSLTLDFYPSQLPGIRPCVIVVHGGSWKSGDNKQLPELNSYLADAGYHVAAINYRLAPEFKSPVPVQDVNTAVTYLCNHAQKLRIDQHNLVLLGRSAGAQIALLAAYTSKIPGLKGVVDFYGPADMVWGYSVPANPLVMNSRKVMEDYLGGTYSEIPDNYAASSPLNFVSKTSVPTLIIHGQNDVLVAYEHSERLHKKLQQYGVKNYFLSLPWATHGFDYNINGPGGQISTHVVKEFIQQVTSQKNVN